MTIRNTGSTPDRLVGGSVLRSPAGSRSLQHGDGAGRRSRCDRVEGGLVIGPGETLELKPGALHAMLTGLKQPLEKGRKVKGTLEFEKAGKVDIEYSVEPLGASSPAPGGHRH